MSKPDIKPDRNNWREFCEEPPLTDEEWETWEEMCATIILNPDLMYDKNATTSQEYDEFASATERHTEDWRDIVQEADASRRLTRAEIAWWEEQNDVGARAT